MTVPAFAAIKAQFILSTKDAKRYDGTILSYDGVVNHLLRRYETEAVIAKAVEEIRNFK